MRVFIEIAYKGTHYHGWQRQENAISVQQVIEEALGKLLRKPAEIVGSGRTDTGVHAAHQVFHIDLDDAVNMDKLAHQLNAILPFDISVKRIRKVAEEAHARFDAVLRSYEYHINPKKDPFRQGLSYHYSAPLNLEKMNQAAATMKSKTDFECFSRVKTEVYTFNCDIFEAVWKPNNENFVFHVSANRFLRGMVRAIVGTLLQVGKDKMSLEEFEAVLDSKDRTKAGRAVPAEGLFLTQVEYPPEVYLD